MLHSLSRTGMKSVIAALLFAPAIAWGQDFRVRHVQDDAGLFTEAGRAQANRVIQEIADRHQKELFIETVKEGPADPKERVNWGKERFNNYKINGVYVVFSKEPKFFRIEFGNKTREQGYFGAENALKLAEIIKSSKTNDEMLTRAADYTLDTMNLRPPQNAQKQKQGANPPAVPNQRVNHEGPNWLGWVCLIVGVLLVVWVIFAIIRAMTGMGGYGYGGYPGYGYGGGFLPGMLGGMFGMMAGMWMYNNFFGGHANYNTGDWGGGGPGADGTTGYDGDTGTADTGAGGDDWAAGGDAGGGGDWGGGDVGGGGDAGGGCGGGCGGGGCGGGD